MAIQQPEAQDIIIIGATGDLARRKLLPALYHIHRRGLLPPAGRIIGLARRPMGDEGFRELAREAIVAADAHSDSEEVWLDFAERLTYVGLDEYGFGNLAKLATQDQRLLYLAIPPAVFDSTIREISQHDLNKGARIVIEKPFGHDLESAVKTGALVRDVFEESQIFRIDHYLGKETVQNILVLRFGNSIFERIWNRDAIDHIEITIAESDGIEGRGDFYEPVGALRDIVQNHAMQVLALLTMEAPVSLSAEAIRDEKLKLLRAVRPVNPSEVTLGQYEAGIVHGSQVPGYREHDGVAPDSQTATYAALQLSIDNWRWGGVPIYLRTGKHLPRRVTEIEVAFKEVPKTFFEGSGVEPMRPNHLTIQIQPEEEICLSLVAKVPGPELHARQVQMVFSFAEGIEERQEEAYERLLSEVLAGDSTLFVRGDSVERAWTILQPVLDAPPRVRFYNAGTWGPPEADRLIAPDEWHLG